MNETSATSASGLSLLPDGIATLTAIHFTIIAVVAVLVIIGLLWGIKAKRSRMKASHDVIANAKEAGVPPAPIAEQAPSPAPIAAEHNAPEPAPSQAQAQAQTRAPAAPLPTPSAAMPPINAPKSDTPATDIPAMPERPADRLAPAAAPAEASPAPETVAPDPQPSTPEPLAGESAGKSIAAPTRTTYADDPLTQLKGLGPKVAVRLGELGVTTISAMAALSDGEAQSIDAQLGAFTGRMHRDRWIEQARLLAAGDKSGFEAVFGKL